jgi:hypothetical protein
LCCVWNEAVAPGVAVLVACVWEKGVAMSLQFIGDYGIFLPGRDAVGCAALDRNRLVRWYTTRSALEKLGDGTRSTTTMDLVDRFERYRQLLEKAAEIKYRKGKIERDGSVRIELSDLDSVTGH